MGQTPCDAQIGGRVDDGLDPQGTTVFQIVLDPGVLIERVQGDAGVSGDDFRVEHILGMTFLAMDDSPSKDQLERVRATNVQIVADQRVDESASNDEGPAV